MANDALFEELKQRLYPSRFSPFRLTLRNGERLDVVRPLQMGVGLTKFGYVFPDGHSKVERRLEEITSLEPLESTGTPS